MPRRSAKDRQPECLACLAQWPARPDWPAPRFVLALPSQLVDEFSHLSNFAHVAQHLAQYAAKQCSIDLTNTLEDKALKLQELLRNGSLPFLP